MLALRLNRWKHRSFILPANYKASDIWQADTVIYGRIEINWNE